MNTLTKTKRNVEELSESLIDESWDNWDEYEDDYVHDYTRKYDAYITSELNYYYTFL